MLPDLRFALRYFARHRATVSIIVTVLAVATGANTMMFSMFQAQFFRPAPAVRYDGRLARLWAQERATKNAAWNLRGFTWPELRAIADRRDLFDELVAYTIQDVIVGGRTAGGETVTEARAVRAQFVTSNYFAVLHVPLAGGAGFVPQAPDATTAERTAVLSDAMAKTVFGDAAVAVGRTVVINEIPLRVVGIAPPDFQGDARGMDAAIWIPLSARAEIAGVTPRWLESPALQSFARLAPGASRDDATALARRVVIPTVPDSGLRVGMSRTADVMAMTAVPPGPDRLNSIMMFVVLGVVGVLILLIGWMNTSSLMVAAAIARRQEIAVRLSLGASRRRILRQLVTESTLLAVAGGAAGLALAWPVLRWFTNAGIGGIDVMPDAGTFVFALGISLVTGIGFGLSPALHATHGSVATAIRDSGAGSTRQSRLQRTFVTAQIALSQPLLVVLGTLLWMIGNDVGTAGSELRRRVVAVDVYPVPRNGTDGTLVENLDSLSARIARHPEVIAVVPEAATFDKGTVVTPTTPSGRAPESDSTTMVTLQGIAPGWLSIAELPVVLGRDVSLTDTTGTAVTPVVIGTDLAKAMWGDANPIGRTLGAPRLQGMDDPAMLIQVVGVYDASRGIPKLAGSGGAMDPDGEFRIYTAHGKRWRSDLLLVRTRGPGAAVVNDLRQLIRTEAPLLPIESIRTLEQLDAYQASMSVQETALAVAGAVVALLITSLGLYGVVALAVQQRTREIGIRIAMGANPAAVTRMFLRSGVRLAVIALLIGLPVTVAGLQFGQAQGVVNQGPNFWLVGLAVSVVLLAVAGGAVWRPARRAAQVPPAIALRAE